MVVLLTFLSLAFFGSNVHALPAFARRYNVSCSMCHTDGAAPHLTELGYIFRRMAFHLPGQLGDEKGDDAGMKVTNHSAIGINVAYQYADNSSAGKTTLGANGINVPEVELWPLVGGFFGNWGTWSEVDATPATNLDGGGLDIPMVDVRYAYGTPDLFYNFRAGMIAPEGFGASDQWLDDGNIPLMEYLTPFKTQDTLATPLGAMNFPELGFEAGLNFKQSHLTLGYYDGYTDQAIDTTGASSALVPASLKTNDVGMRDVKVQLDQFAGKYGEITAAYYHGSIPLTFLGDATQPWLDNYDQERLYLTAFAIPNKLDLVAGASWAQNQYVDVNTTPAGNFESRSEFVGAFYYANPHLVIAARADKFYYNFDQSATGTSLQISLPYGNRILVFHYNHTASDMANGPLLPGWNNDIGVDLRFLL